MKLNAAELAALRAIGEGRTPAEEVLRARLKRRGLVARGLLGDRPLYVTLAGREVLAESKS